MDTAQFLTAVWGTGLHSVCWLQQDRMRWAFAHSPDQAAPAPQQLSTHDLWFGAHPLHSQPPPKQRGDNSFVAQVVAIPADLDWADPSRRTDKPLPDEATVREALRRLGPDLQPSIVVHSGHGLQTYWRLDRPVTPELGAELIARLSGRLLELGVENGRQDLASILRLPGSTNWKDREHPVPVTIERFELGRLFLPEYLQRHVPLPTGWTPSSIGNGTRHHGGMAITDAQLDVQNFVIEHHSGHSPQGRGGVIYLWRPGKDRHGGHSATILVGEQGDAVLTVFSSSWAGIGPDNGEPSWSWVLRGDHLVRAHLADREELDALLDAGTALNHRPPPVVRPVVGAAEEEEVPPTRFLRYRLTDVAAAGLDVSWMAIGMLCKDSYGLTGGELKSLKSYLGQARDVALAAGIDVLGQWKVPERQRVLVYIGEGGRKQYVRRVARWCEAYGIDLAALDGWLEIVDDIGPLDGDSFRSRLREHLETFQPQLVHIDPLYPYQPAALDSHRMSEVGQLLARVQVLCARYGASFWTTAHMNQSGQGFDLKRIAGAGHGEWADSWMLVRHREAPDVDAGRFRLAVAMGSRQWGGTEWSIDLNVGRFDQLLGRHDGRLGWAVTAGVASSGATDDVLTEVKLDVLRVGRRAHKPLTRASWMARVHRRTELKRTALDELIETGQIVAGAIDGTFEVAP